MTDLVGAYRGRTYFWLALVGAAVLFPFSLNNFFQGRTLLGIGTMFFVGVLTLNAVAMGRDRKPPVPAWLVFGLAIVSVGVSIKSQGVVGLFWCYPAMALIHFLLTARIVSVANAFVGMVSKRAYREALDLDRAVDAMLSQVGKAFDRRVVAALINYLDNRGGRAQWAAGDQTQR